MRMEKYFGSVASLTTGAPIAGAAISVTQYGTNNPVTLYSEDGSDPIVGALLSDATGFYEFFIEPGHYNIAFSVNNTVIRTIRDVSIGVTVSDISEFGGYAGAADITDELNEAIAWLNLGPYRTLTLGDGFFNIAGDVDPLTQTGTEIRGNGPSTHIRRSSSAGTRGTFFTFGNDAGEAQDCRIHGFKISCLNTPDPDNAAFYFYDAVEVRVRDIWCENIGRLGKFGADSTNAANRCRLQDITGNVNKGLDAQSIYEFVNGSALHVTNCLLSGAGDSDGVANSAHMRVAPGVGCLIDTLYVTDCSCQMWTSGQVDGKPHAVRIDNTNGAINNLWFTNLVGDHTSVSAVRITNPGTHNISTINFSKCRFATDAGHAYHVSASSSGLIRGLKIDGTYINVDNNSSGLLLTGLNNYKGCSFINNEVLESQTGTSKDYAIQCGANDWTFSGNVVGQTGGGTGWQQAFRTTADVTRLVVTGNDFQNVAVRAFQHFSYTTASAGRIFEANTISSASGDIGDTVTASTISSNQTDFAPAGIHYAKTLRVVTDGGDYSILSLAGGHGLKQLTIQNVGTTGTVTLPSESASGTAAMRFAFPSSLRIGPRSSVRLIYDKTSSRWRAVDRFPNVARTGTITFGTLGFTGTAPTSDAGDTLDYRVVRNGQKVSVYGRLFFNNAGGASYSVITIPFSSMSLPAPLDFAGVGTGAQQNIGPVSVTMAVTASSLPAASRGDYYKDASDAYQIRAVAGAAGYAVVTFQLDYLT